VIASLSAGPVIDLRGNKLGLWLGLFLGRIAIRSDSSRSGLTLIRLSSSRPSYSFHVQDRSAVLSADAFSFGDVTTGKAVLLRVDRSKFRWQKVAKPTLRRPRRA